MQPHKNAIMYKGCVPAIESICLNSSKADENSTLIETTEYCYWNWYCRLRVPHLHSSFYTSCLHLGLFLESHTLWMRQVINKVIDLDKRYNYPFTSTTPNHGSNPETYIEPRFSDKIYQSVDTHHNSSAYK